MVYLVGYVLTIFLANWTLQTFGLIPVWPGVLAPAGVLWAGLALTLRDLTQDSLGRPATYGAIVVGAALSALVSPQFALASGAAFLISETADMLVYTPIRQRHWIAAIAASNIVGLVVDSALFLWLAFGSLDFLLGQIVGKVEVTALTVAVLWLWRRGRRPGEVPA
jgi:queuosine precursor transporter